MKKIILIIIILLLIAGGGYWYFFMRDGQFGTIGRTGSQGGSTLFGTPTGDGQTNITGDGSSVTTGTSSDLTGQIPKVKPPTLRLLSNTPVGGYGASTTASTTVVRWVDRGRGNVYEAYGDTLDIRTISNTIVPKIYESVWNKTASSFIAATLNDDNTVSTLVYADIRERILPKEIATSTATSTSGFGVNSSGQSLTKYELKGKELPPDIIAYAVSPKKDKLFMLINDNGIGVGYVSTFDGKSIKQIFTTPLTQVNVEWPEEKILAITTRGSADEGGYLYFVDPISGVWNKVMGPLRGLGARVSMDAKHVIVSAINGNDDLVTSIYNITKRTGVDAIIQTIADKCVWGNFYKELVYCAAPTNRTEAVYPDDWYSGKVSMVDKIWQINANTGEVKLISSIIDTSNRVIDAFHLGIDDKDNFLYFMNKNDLSLWSLDLVSSE